MFPVKINDQFDWGNVNWGCWLICSIIIYCVVSVVPKKKNKYIVKDKVENNILVQNAKTDAQKVITFSQAYQDSIVYNNINIGDKLRTCDVRKQRDPIVPNLRCYDGIGCDSRITRINGKRTAKMIRKYEHEIRKQKSIADTCAVQISEQQLIQQHMQTAHTRAGR